MCSFEKDGAIKQICNMLEVDQQVEFLQVPELYALHSDQQKFVFPHSYDAASKALIDKYPEDEKGIMRLMKLLGAIRSEGFKLPRSPLKRKLMYPFMPVLYPNLVEASRHTVGTWLNKYITNENAKLDLLAHIVYWGDWNVCGE